MPRTELFDVKAKADFDRDGRVEAAQVEVQGLLDLFVNPKGSGLPADHSIRSCIKKDAEASFAGLGSGWAGTPAGQWSEAQMAALYNYKLIVEDRSRGVHNLTYTVEVLYDTLKGPGSALRRLAAAVGGRGRPVCNAGRLLYNESHMIAFKNLKEILSITLQWEGSLKDFYDVAEFALKSEPSKKAVRLLRAKLEEKLVVLRGVKPEDFGKTEWIRFTLDYKPEELNPGLDRTSEAGEIFRHLVEFQGKLAAVYRRIAETIVSRGQKELFESLARFKEEQGAEVRRLQENYRPE